MLAMGYGNHHLYLSPHVFSRKKVLLSSPARQEEVLANSWIMKMIQLFSPTNSSHQVAQEQPWNVSKSGQVLRMKIVTFISCYCSCE